MFDLIKEFWVQIYAVISLTFLIANWFLAKTYAKTDAIAVIEKRVDKLEIIAEHSPSKEDFHQLDKRMAEVNGQLTAIAPQLKSLQSMTEMLTENELRGK
ncbi:DUF2730 family protein [Shewanella glacialimarina]|uniref:DUF2730 family protein n=1 Tax=Shewanella glacialimarina TaxID=2590884 RepID=UPI001CF8F0B0|nr:DUF2730 family protein [Shewanella glacialimarina]